MMTAAVADISNQGFENRTFECLKCGHSEVRTMVADPLATGAAKGWISGLAPPE
jgi:transcription elongation factor Elf1